jgi:4-aminobutyrate aminotransferase-like enzyme
MIPGPKSKRLLKQLRRAECPHVTYGDQDFPIFIRKAKDCVVTDVDGNRYTDFTSFFAVSSLGHANPGLARVMRRQAKSGWHAMGDVHPHELKLQASLALQSVLPQKLSRIFYSNSGSDAVETALKTAFLYTRKPKVLAFEGAYHGLGYGAMQATHRKFFREPFMKQTGSMVYFKPFVPENEWKLSEVQKYLTVLQKFIRQNEVGAVLIEPIQGRAGIRAADLEFLKGLSRICRQTKSLLIFDEIYTGMGRTGSWFAFEQYGVTPDMICLGKGIANGFPISVCAASPKIMRAWGKSRGEAKHTSTFLGNPLGCAMMIETIQQLKRRKLVRQSKKRGEYFKRRLTELAAEYPRQFGAPRGRGLMLGIEIKSGRAVKLAKQLLKDGFLVLPSGPKSEILTFTPPLTISRSAMDRIIQRIKHHEA